MKKVPQRRKPKGRAPQFPANTRPPPESTNSLGRNQILQAAGILILILNVAFYNVLWGGGTLMASANHTPSITPTGAYDPNLSPAQRQALIDQKQILIDPGAPSWQFEPGMAFEHDEWFHLHLPLWNPYVAYGAPWAADMQSQPFFPPSFLLALHPTPRTLSWFLVFRLFTAGFFTYLFLRFFVDHLPALAAGIACMLTGYYIYFLNNDHLSTETLLPLLFYCVERLLHDSSVKNRLITAGAVYLSFVSGMPESTFLTVLYAWAYFAWRVATEPDLRRLAWSRFGALVQCSVLGLALASFLLIPFLEFLRNGYDLHRKELSGITAGLAYVDFTHRILLPYLAPLVASPEPGFSPRVTGRVQAWGYFGVTAAAISLLGAIHSARKWRSFQTSTEVSLTAFFLLSAVMFFLKHYGHWSVNWIGLLPLFDVVYYPKYLQPLIGFAVATLTGLGAGCAFSGRARRFEILGTALLLFILILAMAAGYRDMLGSSTQRRPIFYFNLLAIISCLLLLSFLLSCCVTRDGAGSRLARFGRFAVICTLAAELCGNYVFPLYRIMSQPSPVTLNPYRGAPYIRYLQDRTRDFSRVFGRDGFLYPDWASAFQLSDVRYMHGITWSKYLDFLHAFLAPAPAPSGNRFPSSGDLADRFTGDGYPYEFLSWKEQRFLQLSSIRYLISGRPIRSGRFRQAYDGEAKVFEYSAALPRASIFYDVALANNQEDALEGLQDLKLDVFRTVIIAEGNDVVRRLLASVNGENGVEPASIDSYGSQRVFLHADLKRPGVVMLTDSNYPGWNAYLDGRRVPILSANFLFRGVLAPAGTHSIEFRYEPRSFFYGACITFAGLAVAVGWWFSGTSRPIDASA